MDDRRCFDMSTVVAIDGPSGSGKSSVSLAVAARLGFDYLDTGAVYRALGWQCLELDVDLDSSDAVLAALRAAHLMIGTDPGHFSVSVNGRDIGDLIRVPRIAAAASSVAALPAIRSELAQMFQAIMVKSEAPGIVVEGRDITTVVAPDAAVRILLTASAEARLGRRSAQFTDPGSAGTAARRSAGGPSADQFSAEEFHARDVKDSRVVDFMAAAPGVSIVDSTGLLFEQTVEAVVDLVIASAHPS